jgi:hypothetical protein
MLAATAILTGALAAAGAEVEPGAAHDAGVVRAVGLGWSGIFRGLDVLLGAPGAFLPLGTRALGAALASALVAAAAAAVAYEIAYAFVSSVVPALFRAARDEDGPDAASPGVSPSLLAAVPAVAVLAATLAPAWQSEASAPGGDVVGALVVLAAVAFAQRVQHTSIRPLAFVLGLAATEGPFVFVAALASAVPRLGARPQAERRETVDAAIAFALGLLPLAIAVATSQRPPELALMARTFAVETGARGHVYAFANAEIGVVLLAIAAVGAVLAARIAEARRALASILLVIAVGAGAIALGAPSSESHVAAPILAAIAAVHVLAAVTLAAGVIAIARMKVPFAQASATLVVVLELVLPVRVADETSSRREAHAPRATATWDEAAWGTAPPGAVVLVPDRGTMRRAAAARATGSMRGDLVLVPAFDLDARQARRALATEPKLAPLYRDVALGIAPEELSLAQIAAERPLLASFDSRWDRTLARHLVPVGLASRVETEPRGASDRKRALDLFEPWKDRLVRVASPKRDPDLAAATATLLRARAIAMAACSEKDILAHALDDLRPFAPDDPVATTLVRRMVTSKGTIDVKDLSP